jgi:hypothetical protein
VKSKFALLCLALLVTSVASLSFVTVVDASPPQYDLRGVWTFDDIYQGVHYYHTMTITSYDSSNGVFSGTGFYNSDPSLTWAISGTENGNSVDFVLTVLTSSAEGTTLAGSGSLTSETYMSGEGLQSNLNPHEVTWTSTRTQNFQAPEYPVGTIAALGACFVGLALFKKRGSLPKLSFSS